METIKEICRIKLVTIEAETQGIYMPEDAAEIAQHYIGDEDREVFLVLHLNTKNQINAIQRAHVGSINASIVHPREVYKAACRYNAASVIVAHNHPSGDPNPSREDIKATKRLQKAGEILGIELLDSLIVGPTGRHYSLKRNGYMDT
jgi:DNA repair protein RadC